jgi:hypothetical protein
MDDFKIVDPVPASLQLIPIQRIEAAMGCSHRTLVKRLDELGIPMTRVSHNTRGLTVADLGRFLVKIQNHRPIGSVPIGR